MIATPTFASSNRTSSLVRFLEATQKLSSSKSLFPISTALDTLPNFEKAAAGETTAYGVQYDTGSVMHYSSTAFSRNGQKTIEALVSF